MVPGRKTIARAPSAVAIVLYYNPAAFPRKTPSPLFARTPITQTQ